VRAAWTLRSVAVSLGIASAAGQATAVELDFQAPDECSEAQFVRHLELSAERALDHIELFRLEVRVTKVGDSHWGGRFKFTDSDGVESPVREIHGESCDDVSEATAVAIAMALYAPGPAAETPGLAPGVQIPDGPKGVRDATAEPPASPPNLAESPKVDAERATVRPVVWLAVLGDTDLLGTPTFGGELGAALAWGPLEAGVGGGLLVPTNRRVTEDTGIHLEGYLTQAYACYVARAWRATPRACLAYDLNVVVGEGTGAGLAATYRQTLVAHALQPQLGVAFPFAETLELRLQGGVAIGLNRGSFVLDEGQVAYELPPFTVQGALSIAWSP
jgi:hypothetical protein